MTKQEKIMYWFLIIITLGLIKIYWKTKKVEVKNELSKSEKITVNINMLITLLGNKENIKNVEATHQKVKIHFLDREKININEIKEMKGVSGIFVTSSYIQIIVGNEAQSVAEAINLF